MINKLLRTVLFCSTFMLVSCSSHYNVATTATTSSLLFSVTNEGGWTMLRSSFYYLPREYSCKETLLGAEKLATYDKGNPIVSSTALQIEIEAGKPFRLLAGNSFQKLPGLGENGACSFQVVFTPKESAKYQADIKVKKNGCAFVLYRNSGGALQKMETDSIKYCEVGI